MSLSRCMYCDSLVALFKCFTQVLPYQTYSLLDPDIKVGSCMYSTHCLLNIEWHNGTHFNRYHSNHPPNMVSPDFLCNGSGCNIMSPLMSSLLFLPNDLFIKHFPKSLCGSVYRGRHFCVTVFCLYHLQHSFDNHMALGILQFMH